MGKLTTTIKRLLFPPSATVAELESQLAASQELLERSAETERSTYAEFIERGDPDAKRLWHEARAARESVAVDVGRAQQLLKAAQEREGEAQRAADARDLTALESELSRDSIAGALAGRSEAEQEAWSHIADQRLDLADSLLPDLRAKQAKAQHLQSKLGCSPPTEIYIDNTGTARTAPPPLGHAIDLVKAAIGDRAALTTIAVNLPADDPRRDRFAALIRRMPPR